ncbi:protein kinase [Micromonospora sp. NPDC049523]|uniref:protein kinase domain-containing protein n=1 Tax=Micromonospora sp. NPDC049523 TaxID=3155921 RepID=UPI003438B592
MAGRVIADRYELQTMLGRGGMAVVWRGVDLRLGRSVAVKLLNPAGMADPSMLERFDREARTAARLGHPNIVAVHDVGSDGGEPYLVMELVDGPNLATLLGNGPLPLDRALEIAGQVCGALATAHAAGVVHRDIKPANILIDPAGTVKVCDFGIARLLHAGQATLTAPATTVGTSQYMAPEQAAGDPVDARTDLYALGCLLYAMLTGQPPFTGDNPLRVLWQHLHEPAPALASVRPGTPPELDRLVGQLLAKDPADRPTSATEVRDRLAAVSSVEQRTVVVEAPPLPPVAQSSAPGPAGPVRGAASVVARTRKMPALDDGAGHTMVTSRDGGSGSRRVLTATLGAILLAVIVVGILLATRGGDGNTGPEAGAVSPSASSDASAAAGAPTTAAGNPVSPTSPASPTSPTSRPAGGTTARLVALQTSLDRQVQAQEVDADAAEDLNDKLDDVARKLIEGDTEDAAKKLADVRDRLAELRDDNKVSSDAYDVLLANLDSLAESLPPTGKRRGNGDDEN